MMKFTTKPSRKEMIWGGVYLILYMVVLPWLIPLAAPLVFPDWNAAQVNFLYFSLNFAATAVIFRKFLFQSVRDAMQDPGKTLWSGILCFVINMFLTGLVASLVLRLDPGFSNVNDDSIQTMVGQNRTLMAIGAVVLAPITEELLFRGLLFRGLHDRSHLGAHLVTIFLFSLVHITGYIGHYDIFRLMLCFIQYLPAAWCLNFAYQKSGTILSPIVMHMLTNLFALGAMR